MALSQQPFGTTGNGAAVERYTLSNAHGIEVDILTYGGVISALRVPDRQGVIGDIALGFDYLEPYLGEHPYFGSLIGRYGNRIANGRFTLDGVPYQLARNNGTNHLHGGLNGFNRQVWQAQALEAADGPSLVLHYFSRDGEENYPGNLDVTVIYTLTDNNDLRIEYRATTDRATVLNLTNHGYFNLSGGDDILSHQIEIAASRFVPIDEVQIPLGDLQAVQGTPMDFLTPHVIGERIDADDVQIRNGLGYDHCWVLDKPAGELGFVARAYDPTSGRTLEAYTTQPGVQFYTGNFLDGSLIGKQGKRYISRSGFCLETQHFPDSPNQPQFPSTTLQPGEVYQQTTIYRFGVAE